MKPLRWVMLALFGLAAGLATGALFAAVAKGRAAIQAQAEPLPRVMHDLTGFNFPETGGVPVVLRPVVEGKDVDEAMARRENSGALLPVTGQ